MKKQSTSYEFYSSVLLQASHCPYPGGCPHRQYQPLPTAPPYLTLFSNVPTSEPAPFLPTLF